MEGDRDVDGGERVRILEERLRKALAECARLREENARLRALLGEGRAPGREVPLTTVPRAQVHRLSPAPEKIALFRSVCSHSRGELVS